MDNEHSESLYQENMEATLVLSRLRSIHGVHCLWGESEGSSKFSPYYGYSSI